MNRSLLSNNQQVFSLLSPASARGFTFKLRAFIVKASARSEPTFADLVFRDLSMIFLLFYLAFRPTSALPFSERDRPLHPPYILPFEVGLKLSNMMKTTGFFDSDRIVNTMRLRSQSMRWSTSARWPWRSLTSSRTSSRRR